MKSIAVIYCRVSSARQAEEELPIQSQLDACRIKAEKLGAIVLDEFLDEGISAKNDKRPAFQSAIATCEASDVDFFITWSTSRFARNKLDASLYKSKLKKCGTKMVYVTVEIDTESDEGFILDSISEMMDELYSRQVSKDTKRSLINNAKKGNRNGGRAPFGYDLVPNPENPKRRILAINENEAKVVRKIFDYKSKDLIGSKSIALLLNEIGFTNRGKKWAKNTILYLLNNEAYIGVTVFNRKNRLGGSNPESEWIRTHSHESIISQEQFNRVKEMKKQETNNNQTSSSQSECLFTGLLKCECGAKITTETATGRGKKRYKYYVCSAQKSGKKKKHFDRIPTDEFDTWLMGNISKSIFNKETIAEIAQKTKLKIQNMDKTTASNVKLFTNQINKLKQEVENLWQEIESGNSPDSRKAFKRINEKDERIEILKEDLVKIKTPKELPNLSKVSPETITKFMEKMLKETSLAKKRGFLSTFIDKIETSGDTVTVSYHPDKLTMNQSVHSEHNWLLEVGSNHRQTD